MFTIKTHSKGESGCSVVPKDCGRILLRKHEPCAGERKGPGTRPSPRPRFSHLWNGVTPSCLGNDKVLLASADGGRGPALHAGKVPGPRLHTSHASSLAPALRGRGTGHESRLGWRVRGIFCPAASTWWPSSVCVCLLVCVWCSLVPLIILQG